MSCAPFDLRDYYFEELPAAERRTVRDHVDRCSECTAELERMRVTAAALASLAAEEIPQRIAFVSDKVFEPSPVRRWWGAFWLSGARTLSAAATILAGAIVFHAVRTPAASRPPEIVRTVSASPVADPAVIQASVDRAVAKAEARYETRLRTVEAQYMAERNALMVRVSETLNHLEYKRNVYLAANGHAWDGQ